MTTRREFLQAGTISAVGLSVSASALPESGGATSTDRQAPSSFLDLLRPPDSIIVQTTEGDHRLRPGTDGRWQDGALTITLVQRPESLRVQLSSPAAAVERIWLRWHGSLDRVQLVLGDAWERGYGDLEWRGFVPDRVMPWYFATWDGDLTHVYGVRTGAGAFCFWLADPAGIGLCADVRSGGVGVQLGDRELAVCDVVCRPGRPNESPFGALHTACLQMCAHPRLPAQPIYGSNDWYWAYGHNSAASVLRDARHIVELAPPDPNRPFAVIDDGWQPERGRGKLGVGTWDHGNERFPDMPGLAAAVRATGARPGIWIRPLLAPADVPDSWRLPRERRVLDPTVPAVLEKVAADIGRLRTWGFELVKHDYSTFDLTGRWGFQMGASLTKGGWTFAAGPTHTTAEVIDQLYRTIRTAAQDTLIIGCNTVSHLSAGRFESCRIGDDTSGRDWSRARRMGVNTLAFRGAQQGAFYAADPDCVGVTNDIPWEDNRQWLDLVARSGTVLFVSLAPDALGEAQRQDLRAALARAAQPQPPGQPLDWQRDTWPRHWRMGESEISYDWIGPDGVVV